MAGIACGFMPLGGGSGVNWERQNALEVIEKIFKEIDSDCDGLIKVESFIAFMMLNGVTVPEKDKAELTKLTDRDGEIKQLDLQRSSLDCDSRKRMRNSDGYR